VFVIVTAVWAVKGSDACGSSPLVDPVEYILVTVLVLPPLGTEKG